MCLFGKADRKEGTPIWYILTPKAFFQVLTTHFLISKKCWFLLVFSTEASNNITSQQAIFLVNITTRDDDTGLFVANQRHRCFF